jgi:predicted site-specific integrase-resolvase
MVTTDEAAILARVSARTIFRWVEAGRVHYTETPEGLLLICPDSLAQTQKEKA